jgi:hypothetical protein
MTRPQRNRSPRSRVYSHWIMRALASLIPAVFLSACALQPGYSLHAGASTVDDVYRTMGRPATEVPAADGSRYLAYPTGPLGMQTYMAHVGRDGVVRSVGQVLDDDHIYRITPGLTRDDILRLIGPPGQTDDFPRLDQTAWDYRYLDTWGYIAILSVMFDRNGIVVGRFTRRIEPERGRDEPLADRGFAPF